MFNPKTFLKIFILFVLTPICFTPIVAQSSTATLTGTVEDQNGQVIPNATVTITDLAKGLKRTTTTNDSGSFSFVLLTASTYTVMVEQTGFGRVQLENVILNVGDQKALQVTLKVGDVNAAIEVRPDETLVKTDGSVGTIVDRQFVENLPLNGRSFQSLIALTPGVVLTKATISEQGQFSVNGQRPNSNNFMVDGVSANIGSSPGNVAGQSTAGSLPGFGATGGTNNLVSVDALQEFKIQTSTYAPEFGRATGGQVSIVTRSGSNEFHGTLFEYFRNDALDANDWFANSLGKGKAALRQNDFGGVLGGPLYLPRFGEGGPAFYSGKNRTFFFFSYEGLRLRLPQTGITTVPSMNAREQAAAQRPQMLPFLNAFPLPNGRDLANNLSEFIATYSDPSTLDATSIRVDHTVNSKLTLFARYNYAPSEAVNRGNFGSSALSNLIATEIKTQTLTGGATLAITPTVSNDFRANYSKNDGLVNFSLDNFGGAVPPGDSILYPAPVSSLDGHFILGVGSLFWQNGRFGGDTQRQINLVDTLSLIAGSHSIKVGVDYRRLSPIFDRAPYQQGASFTDVNQALTGTASLVFVVGFLGPRLPVFTNLSLFAQDTWKATTRLTLTYGVRWDFNPPPHDARGRGNDPLVLTGLENPATIAVAPLGTPLYKTSYRDFAPRVGVAYQLSQARGRETVLRGGFGVFYDLGTTAAASAFSIGPPYTRQRNTLNAPFPLDPVSAIPPPFTLTPPFVGPLRGLLDPNFKFPYTLQWNLSVEQALGQNQTLSASYVGAVGRRLPRQESFVSQNPSVTNRYLLTRSVASSDYHALQLQFQRRLSRGFQALASYTWAHSIDDVSSDSTLEAPLVVTFDPSQERGSSDFDVRHSFNAAVTYDIPAPFKKGFASALLRNFSVDAIFTARSATPVNVITGVTGAGGSGVSRANLIPGIPLYIYDPTFAGGRRINTAVPTLAQVMAAGCATPITSTNAKGPFCRPSTNRQGTLGRNALRGLPVWQLDIALRRQFSLTERVKLQLKSEFFNVFNHPNFADPVNRLSDPRFGQSIVMFGRSLGSGGSSGGFNPLYQIGGPRSIQLAFKLVF